VIGVNVAVSSQGQNISFALPINLVSDMLQDFNQRGGFGTRAYLGVQYFTVRQAAALANDLPQGAYIQMVVPGSTAEKAGLQPGDIITKFNNQELTNFGGGLAEAISQQRAGDTIPLEIWHNGSIQTITINLGHN